MTRTIHNLIRTPSTLLTSVLLSTTLATFLPIPPTLQAAERAAETRSLTVACDHRYLSQRQAGWLLGIDNVSHAYARRAALHADLSRACAAGVAAVRVQGRRQATPEPRMVPR